jgi:hypothetical protein
MIVLLFVVVCSTRVTVVLLLRVLVLLVMVLLLVVVCSTLATAGLLLRVLILFVMVRSLPVVRSLRGARRTSVGTVANSALRIDRVLPIITAIVAVVDAFRAN